MSYQIGNVISPVTAGTANASLITTCDPALNTLGALFYAVLRAKLDAAWAAAGQLGHTHAVGEVCYLDPKDFWQRTWTWPLLALWRVNEQWTQRTAVWDTCESTIRGVYVLPPLTYEYANRLSSIRHAAMVAIRGAIESHGDTSYSNGVDFLAAPTANIEQLWLTSCEYDSIQGQELQQQHPAVSFTLSMRERQMPNYTGISTASEINSTILEGDLTNDYVEICEEYFDPTTA
jgi:hypothetical protein